MKKTENFEYYGIFINDNSKNKLKEFLSNIWRYNTALCFAEKQYIDHCTVLHKSEAYKKVILNYCECCLGIKLSGKITAVGWSDKSMAFKVKFPGVPFPNKTPHITIATFDGGRPVDSNDIEIWEELEEPIEIIGKLGVRTSNGIIDYGE